MMKDKLVKYNHRKAYYRLRTFFFSCLVCLAVSAAMVTPIAISMGVASVTTHATDGEEIAQVSSDKLEEVEEPSEVIE